MSVYCGGIQGTIALHEHADWPAVLRLLSDVDLAATAKEKRAFLRRRGVPDAAALLRLALAYAVSPLSLRSTVAWASQAAVAELSDVALLGRLRNAAEWLDQLWQLLLRQQVETAPLPGLDLVIRIIDATCVSCPRSKGTDFRLHVDYRPQEGQFGAAVLSDGHVSEGFHHFTPAPGELWIGDRGYAKAKGIRHVLLAGAQILIRIGWRSLVLLDALGQPLNLLKALESLPKDRVHSIPVQVAASSKKRCGFCSARLVLAPLPPDAAQKSRRKAAKKAKHQGRKILPEGTVAAGWIILLTSLDDAIATAEQIVALYRLRWQIELAFKRLKSILHFDELTAKDPELARATVAASLVAALLVDRLMPQLAQHLPHDADNRHPIWGLYSLAVTWIFIAVINADWTKNPAINRLIEPPRKRKRQLPALIARLS